MRLRQMLNRLNTGAATHLSEGLLLALKQVFTSGQVQQNAQPLAQVACVPQGGPRQLTPGKEAFNCARALTRSTGFIRLCNTATKQVTGKPWAQSPVVTHECVSKQSHSHQAKPQECQLARKTGCAKIRKP
jgi:hypothetical protein